MWLPGLRCRRKWWAADRVRVLIPGAESAVVVGVGHGLSFEVATK